ncbi:hypothetical protein [Rheinheimera mangrovi]|jgi:hypothetical protein|uniref:hypothetical protein n=1 Tax=Rheinheimera mangrovi TaxID=2498451 RepID=UPI000F8DB1B0|nr:hypothetical protein [Rheinheimera mangrovi]
MKLKPRWPLVLFALLVVCSAQSQIIQRPLYFGTIITTGNTIVSRIVVPRSGKPYSTHQLQIVEDAYPSELTLQFFPAYTELHLTPVVPTELRASADPLLPPFIVESLDIPLSIFTDGNGESQLIIGATIKTTGDGRPYPDASYTGSIDIVVNY